MSLLGKQLKMGGHHNPRFLKNLFQAPGHTIHNCYASKAAKTCQDLQNCQQKGHTGKHNDRQSRDAKTKLTLAASFMITPPSKTAQAVHPTSSNSINVAPNSTAAANEQWPTDG